MSVPVSFGKDEKVNTGPLDRMTVFQEALSTFNQSDVSAKKARRILTDLIRLIDTGETISEEDGTKLFFTITKLFHKEVPALRQIIYLAIKELRAFTDNVIMGTSVIMKDVQGAHGQIFRPNAIRALARIIDGSGVESIDRLIRAAIVDKDGSVSSAALVSSYHLLGTAKDTVRRWSAETSEALTSAKTYNLLQHGGSSGSSRETLAPVPGVSSFTQYHALGLLYHMRVHDRVALLKMIQQLGSSQASLRSPQAIVLLIRYIGNVIDDDPRLRPTLYSYLEGWLRHRSDMVNIEAARVILRMRSTSPSEAQSVILVMQSFLGSPRAPSRFAAIRILSEYAVDHPQAVALANTEIEGLISDPNRSVATYAITTLLKTGSESSVDSLIGQITEFMGDDIGDDFRLIVVDAIRSLALKFPGKHEAMLKFFSNELQIDSGIELKRSIVDALFDIIRASPDSQDAALSSLCEFIEDSEYTELTVRILHLLGAVGPQTSNPSQYVRYIFNRVVLENSLVRAAAVSALSKFALVDDVSLQKSINVLLKRCLLDPTDEVRDRAALNISVIQLGPKPAAEFLAPKQKLSLDQLESHLVSYVSDPGNFDKPFSASSVPRVTDEQRYAEKRNRTKIAEVQQAAAREARAAKQAKTEKHGTAGAANGGLPSAGTAAKTQYEKPLAAIPEFAAYGELLHSSPVQALTETEMEYVVNAVVHVYKDYLVLQFDINNTYEAILENVRVELDIDEYEGLLEEALYIPIEKLEPNTSGTAYVALQRSEDLVTGSVPAKLRYVLKEDADDEGQEDEYGVQELELTPGDYTVPTFVASFTAQWDELAGDEETTTRQFTEARTVDEAVRFVVAKLGLMPLDGTENDIGEASHALKLFGRTLSDVAVAAQIKLVKSSKSGIVGKIQVRTSGELAEAIANSV